MAVNDTPTIDQRSQDAFGPYSRRLRVSQFVWGVAIGGLCFCSAIGLGYWIGSDRRDVPMPIFPLAASAAESSDSLAVATGPINEEVEGVFFVDFNTGDLQCLVYYPRIGAFGAHYYTNVRQQLGGGGKNSKYLLVTGYAETRSAVAGGRPANSLVYVTDVTSGMFAAYAVPWDTTAMASGRPQAGPLVFVGGGPIRNYQLPANPAASAPPAVVDPNAKPNANKRQGATK